MLDKIWTTLTPVLNKNEQNAFCLENKIVDSIITTHIKVFSTLVTFTKSNKLSPHCANIIIFPNRGRQRRHHVWRGTGGRQSQVRLCKLNSMIGWDNYKFERGRSLVAMRVNALKQLPTPWLLQCGVLFWGFKIQTKFKHAFLHSIIIFSSFIWFVARVYVCMSLCVCVS